MEKQANTDRIEVLAEGVWAIDDSNDNSLYLIEGATKAILIDTGMALRPLAPVLKACTSKPIELVLTHAHIDHMDHEDEFDRVYLHEADMTAWNWPLKQAMAFSAKAMFHIPVKRHQVKRFHPLRDGDLLDLGNHQLSIISAPGHTPGSILILDHQHQMIFTGDAFGSGGGAWMWLPASLGIRAYQAALEEVLRKLTPYQSYTYYGGHRRQGKPFASQGHLLNLTLVEDMHRLCQAILSGTVEPAKVRKGLLNLLWYAQGEAGLVTRKGKLR